MATNNHLQIYLEKSKQLAQTIVIKSTDIANAMNLGIEYVYGTPVDTADMSSWVYYKHLAGEYHFTDQEMTVVSMDTLETIVFSKANLKIHRATARAYAYGTRSYRELVSRYPKQEQLILGILYPVDMTKAINAEDGAILGYPPALVEDHEFTFIERLQAWVTAYKTRWVNNQYTVSDNLYTATQLGIMYLHLYPAILNVRLAACKTNEAHSFFVRQYLVGHGLTDYQIDNMTMKQSLFMYRNIKYIQRYAGHRENLAWLTEHIMTERLLPLAEYTMRHDISKQPENLEPELVFRRKELNLGYSLDSVDVITLEQMLNKQDVEASWNSEFKEETIASARSMMQYSMSNVLATKVMESNMIDYTDSLPYTLESILLNHWIWLAFSNYYQAIVSFDNPKTGERIPLTARESFCLMWYAFNKSMDFELDEIPNVLCTRVVRIPTPTAEDLLKVVDKTLVGEDAANFAIDHHAVIEPVISVDAFYNLCLEIHKGANIQRNMISYYQHKDARAYAFGMISQLYSDNVVEIAEPGENYSAWLAERNIDLSDFDRDDFELLYVTILKEATGTALNTTKSVADIQRAMVGMMRALSSYSVQFLTQINTSRIIDGHNPTTRWGDVEGHLADFTDNHRLNVSVMDLLGTVKQTMELNVNEGGFSESTNNPLTGTLSFMIPDLTDEATATDRRVKLFESNVRFSIPNPPPQNSEHIFPVPGVEKYLQLPQTQRDDVWKLWKEAGLPVI